MDAVGSLTFTNRSFATEQVTRRTFTLITSISVQAGSSKTQCRVCLAFINIYNQKREKKYEKWTSFHFVCIVACKSTSDLPMQFFIIMKPLWYPSKHSHSKLPGVLTHVPWPHRSGEMRHSSMSETHSRATDHYKVPCEWQEDVSSVSRSNLCSSSPQQWGWSRCCSDIWSCRWCFCNFHECTARGTPYTRSHLEKKKKN